MNMNNEALTTGLIRTKTLKTPHLIEAFLSIDRGDFVMKQHRDFAYEDKPLPLVGGATISQPSTVALMLELLQPQPNEKILDVGSGSGWTTALLAECVGEKGKVIGLEIIPEVLKLGKNNLKAYKFKQAQVRLAEKTLGLANEAPFHRILVSAATEVFPHDLSDQLAIGGVMVIPIQHSIYKVTRISEDEVEATEFPGYTFVPIQ